MPIPFLKGDTTCRAALVPGTMRDSGGTFPRVIQALLVRDGNKVRRMRSNFSRMLLHKFHFA